MPLHFRGAMAPVLNWLESLPTTVLDARPSLWVTYASALMMAGQTDSGVEEKLQAAEAALQERRAGRQDPRPGRTHCRHAGHVGRPSEPGGNHDCPVAPRPGVSAPRQPVCPHYRSLTLGIAYQLQGDRAAASRAYTEAISIGQASGNIMITIAGCNLSGPDTGIGKPAPSGGRDLPARPATGRRSAAAGCLRSALGLARIFYEWNDLDAAEQHGQQSLRLARQIEND